MSHGFLEKGGGRRGEGGKERGKEVRGEEKEEGKGGGGKEKGWGGERGETRDISVIKYAFIKR